MKQPLDLNIPKTNPDPWANGVHSFVQNSMDFTS